MKLQPEQCEINDLTLDYDILERWVKTRFSSSGQEVVTVGGAISVAESGKANARRVKSAVRTTRRLQESLRAREAIKCGG
jgi:hypothetical protein